MFELYMIKNLADKIECIAIVKGLNGEIWKVIAVVAWFIAEIAGAGICYSFTGNLLMSLVVCGYPLAFGSYFFIKWKLNSYPDKEKDWLDSIGDSSAAGNIVSVVEERQL